MNTTLIRDLFKELRLAGVRLSLKGENIQADSTGGKIPPHLLSAIRNNKEDIIHYLKTNYTRADSNPVASLGTYELGERIPLSFEQERIWFLDRLQGTVSYHLHTLIKLTGAVKRELIERSFLLLVQRHDTLRTVYGEEDGIPYQTVIPPEGWRMEYRSFEGQPAELQDFLHYWVDLPFDLATDFMVRAALLRVGEEEHVLAVVVHHIAGDGWSDAVLVSEMLKVYESLYRDIPVRLHPHTLRYADYAMWQRNGLPGERMDARLRYWEHRLKGIQPLDLPLDFTRPATLTSNGGHYHYLLDGRLSASILDLCKREGVTLYMAMLAAFKIVLSRYSGQQDIGLGTIVANRPHPDLENIVGFFLNTLVIRTDLSGNPRCTELLAQVKQNTLEAYEYQDVPFGMIVDRMASRRDMSRHPLFDILFTLQNSPRPPALEIPGFQVEPIPFLQRVTQFDINFNIEQFGDRLRLAMTYNADIFREETLASLVAHYRELLISIVADPQQRIDELNMVPPGERLRLLGVDGDAFNPGKRDLSNDTVIHVRFQQMAACYPEAPAVMHRDDIWTYKELDEYANRVGNVLSAMGLQPGHAVGVYLERGPHLIGCLLGILKAGGVYMPLDMGNPVERIAGMVADGRVAAILTTKNGRDLLVHKCAEISFVLTDGGEITAAATDPLPNVSGMDSWAYVLYTSGSTGEPKGAILHHEGVLNHIIAEYEHMELTEGFRFLQSAAIGSDISVWQILGPLLRGGAAVIIDKDDLLDYGKMCDIVEQRKISVVEFVPTYSWGLIHYLKTSGRRLDGGSLSWIMLTGEKVPPQLVNELLAMLPGVRLLNAYGPCEASDDVLQYEITEPFADNAPYVPIGRPIANMNIVILDSTGALCPVGVPGEICLIGAGVGKGYLRDTARTAQAFVRNPFTELGGGSMYRTGDHGRWLADGNVVFLGRMDKQVKIRGYRVELGEISAFIRRQPVVLDCHLILYGAQQGEEVLVAFLVLQEGAGEEQAEREIREHVAQGLPVFMQPGHYVFVAALPTNVSDKVDEAQLIRLFGDGRKTKTAAGRTVIAPRNPIEERLCEIWKELLKLETVSVEDNFFEIGGHSLLVVRAVTAIKAQMGVQLSVGEFFRRTTIAKLAAAIENVLPEHTVSAVTAGRREGPIPLSYSQERLWFIDRLQGSISYHLPYLIRLTGKLEHEQLREAFLQLLQRHEVLRTVYREHDGIPHQEILCVENWVMEQETYDGDPTSFDDHIRSQVDRPFDLSTDYVLRARLTRMGGNEHVLLLVVHHIASDGWSTAILVRELVALFTALRAGLPSSLPPLPVQYADYAIWQRTNTDKLLPAKLAYWQRQLEGSEPLELPADYTRPAVPAVSGRSIHVQVEEELANILQAIAQEQGVTFFITLLAAFKVLLYRYSGQKDISVGTPVANRTDKAIEPLIGCFVNTVVIRSQLDGEMRFEGLLQEMRRTALEAYENQEVPFEKVVDYVVKDRDLSRSPLFQVMFTLNNNEPPARVQIEGLALESLPSADAAAKFDISVNITPGENGLHIHFTYRNDLYTDVRMQRMAAHYIQLLRSAAGDIRTPIGKMQLLSEDERSYLTAGVNTSRTTYPAHDTLVHLFAQQVQKAAASEALVFGSTVLSYAELDRRAGYIAERLKARSIGRHALVAIYSDQPIDMLTGILGIWKAGAAYTPIDEDMPAERMQKLIDDAKPALLFTTYAMNGVSVNGVEKAYLDAQDHTPEDHVPAVEPHIANLPQDVAYVIYTSGSTGSPKGVAVTHRNLMDYFSGVFDATPLADQSSFALLSTFAADLGHTILYSALVSGKTLHLFTKDQIRDVDGINAYFRKNAIDCIKLAPSYWTALNEHAQLAVRKLIIFGGEELKRGIVESLRRTHPGVVVFNHYGPTETTIGKLIHRIEPDRVYEQVPIGLPFSNTHAYVLDAAGQLMPAGVPGLLYISGDGVSNGYLNNPVLTKEKFSEDPFLPGHRMYATGDVVRRGEDGAIVFIGRRDNQVKIRGYRVELGEIEQAFIATGLVQQVVVLMRESADAESVLAAYAVLKEGTEAAAVLRQIRQQLPDYMIPAQLVTLPQLPLTANGKIDRHALPEITGGHRKSDLKETPRPGIETAVAGIWRVLLNTSGIGRNDHFFAMGGHSLLGARVIAAIRRRLGVDLTIRQLFLYPVLKDLSAYIAARSRNQPLASIGTVRREGPIQLSYSQERLWFIDKLQGGSANYHSGIVLHLKGRLHIGHLNEALKAIIQRHEILRTIFPEEAGVPHQVVIPYDGWHLFMSSHEGGRQEMETLLEREASMPFDLSADYPLRARLMTLGNDEYILVVIVHHIAWDGWSRSIFIDELSYHYQTLQERRKGHLAELPVQYIDYSIWQRQALSEDRLEKGLAYWLTKLNGIQRLELPAQGSRQGNNGSKGGQYRYQLDKEVSDGLYALAQREGVTLFMLLLACFKVLLHRYSGQDDISVGTIVADRPHPEVEDLIGFFINTLVLRTDISGNPGFRDYLSQVMRVTLEAYEHQDIPFELVVQKTALEREKGRHPLFDILFSLHNNPVPASVEVAGLSISEMPYSNHSTQFDVLFNVMEMPEGLDLYITYDQHLFNEGGIARLARHYHNLLAAVVKNPDTSVGSLEILTAEERRQVSVTFNHTERQQGGEQTIVELLKQCIALHADHPAVITDAAVLTYSELGRKAGQLADILVHNYGVGKDQPVGVLMDRSEWAILSMMAVLQAGGAYVPIDPEYPDERKTAIIRHSNMKLLILMTADLFDMDIPEGVSVYCIDAQLETDAAAWQEEARSTLPAGSDLAYVIYTSGSTGKPKGVMIEHASLLNYVRYGIAAYSQPGASISMPLFTSLSFDLTQTSIWLPLLTGGVIRVVRDRDLERSFSDLMRDGRINTLKMTPAHTAFLPEPAPNSITTVIVGGERLEQHHLDKLLSLNERVQVFNEYGPTEATVGCTVARLTIPGEHITIGRPIDNTSIFVLGPHRELLPMHVSGEIYIGGAGLARGYLGDETLTQAKFVTVAVNGEELRLYSSGDKGYWLPDGRLEYLDRMDNQVKIRGYRIELQEIESVLLSGAKVREAVVTVRRDRSGVNVLIAYVAGLPGFDKDELTAYLKQHLPGYMVPSSIIVLESMPLTVNGKIDRVRLSSMEAPATSAAGGSQGPQNDLEAKLFTIWQQALQIDVFGREDDFFALGGHSILGVQVMAGIRQELQMTISVAKLFEYPTIAALASYINATNSLVSTPETEDSYQVIEL